MNIEELKAKLYSSCKKAVEMGWQIEPGLFRNDKTKCCCLIEAVGVADGLKYNPEPILEDIPKSSADYLGLSDSDFFDLIAGFDWKEVVKFPKDMDEHELRLTHNEMYKIGFDFRALLDAGEFS